MKSKIKLTIAMALAVACSALLGCEARIKINSKPSQSATTNTPLDVLLEPIQAEAARRGDYQSAAAINFLQAAIVEGRQGEFVRKVAP